MNLLKKRRKRMLDRVEYPSEKDGKSVVVINGILWVDNVQVSFLKDGKSSSDNG